MNNSVTLSLGKILNDLDYFSGYFSSLEDQGLKSKNYRQSCQYKVKEQDEFYDLQAEVAGHNKKNISIKLEEESLTVYSAKNKDEKMYCFSLSDSIDRSGIKAKVEDGMLYLTLPKVKKKKPFQIKVE